MEWIPVFSLIVLVATIGTFIMSVSAYVMFKIKESRKRVHSTRRSARVDAEVVAPAEPSAARGVPTGNAGTARPAGDRLVQYKPSGYNSNTQRTGEEPVAWR